MLPDASCLLPPLTRDAAVSSPSSFYGENATSTATQQQQRFESTSSTKARYPHSIVAFAAVELAGAPSWLNAALGPGLQCFEAASLGMPLEVRN